MDDRRRDGGTNFILRIKEQETRLTLHEHDDDDDDDKMTDDCFVAFQSRPVVADRRVVSFNHLKFAWTGVAQSV